MIDFLWLLVAIAAAHLTALAAPLIWRRGASASFVTAIAVAVLVCCPLLAPADNVHFRAIACLIATDQIFKVIDVCRLQTQQHAVPSFAQYARFLIPFPFLSAVYENRHWHSPWAGRSLSEKIWRLGEILAALATFLLGLGVAFWLVAKITQFEVFQRSFVLDHLKNVILFAVIAEFVPALLLRAERLAGYDVLPLVHRAYLSRTVGEFWQRYNQRVQDWLTQNVFLPTGGKRHRTVGVFLVFLVSGILHEVMFGIATRRFDGYQFLFFILQAPGIWLSERLKPVWRRAGVVGVALARLGTFAWFAATSVFFFHGVYKVFPFIYAGRHILP